MRLDIEEIKNLLRKTDKSMAEIARLSGYSSKTIQNINNGKTHYNSKEAYPLRITSRMVGDLRERLMIPNRKAVPRSNVLSPQLLDYIGLLSLLGVDESCLLEFKEVYAASLSSYFKRELSDSEILSIIKLRPKNPGILKEMTNAYDKPRVKLINLDYWVKTGFIQFEEKGLVIKLIS